MNPMDTTQHLVSSQIRRVLPSNLIVAIVAVLGLFAIPVMLWAVFQFGFKSFWPLYGALVGLLWGLVFGAFIVIRLSTEVRAGGAGFSAAFGVQAFYEWVNSPDIAVNEVQSVYEKLGLLEKALFKIFERVGGSTEALEPTVVAGVWTFVFVFALILAFSMLGAKPLNQAVPAPTPADSPNSD